MSVNKLTKTILGIGLLSAASSLAMGALIFSHGMPKFVSVGDGGSAYVKSGEVVESSVFLTGSNIQMDGIVHGDVYCGGSSATINGEVDGDVLCAGSKVKINGKVSGDVRVAGEEVALGADIGGSVTAAASEITSVNSLKIGRDLTTYSGVANLSGSVGRDVLANGSRVALVGNIGRDAVINASNMKIDNGAKINGALSYSAQEKASIPNGSVAGKVTYEEPKSNKKSDDGGPFAYVKTMLGMSIWILTTALGLLLIAPKKMQSVTSISQKQQAIAAVVGVVSFMVVPVAIVLCAMTLVGLPLAIIGLCLWLIIMCSALPVSAYYLGQRVMRKRKVGSYTEVLVGVAILAVALLIPFINILVILASLICGTGMLIFAVRGEYASEPIHPVKPKARPTKVTKRD